jgi:hypothetical protein
MLSFSFMGPYHRPFFSMKTLPLILLLSSCVTTEKTVTHPDGTVERTVIKAPDAGTVTAISDAALAFAPRATVIHREK